MLRALSKHLHFFNPGKFGIFSFFLISHKVWRFLTPFFIIAMFGLNIALLRRSLAYGVFLFFQVGLIMLGISNHLGKLDDRLSRLSKFFLLIMGGQVLGWSRTVFGRTDVTWKPRA
jgi:hypothetical protein